MAFEYQLYLCLMLLSRLVYLRKDEPGEWWFGGLLAVVQSLLVLLVFGATTMAWGTVAVVLVFSVLGDWLESRLPVHWCRLSVLAGLVLAPALMALNLGHLELSSFAVWIGEVFGGVASVVTQPGDVAADRILSVLLAILLLANEVNIAMRGIFHALDLVPRTSQSPDTREYNAGRVIGILERWLMLLVVLFSDDWSALGFILAAKGLVRFDKLKDPVFAEYMLVGTLMSALFAIAAAWLVQ
ncbi:MAG: hypothetical protein M0Q95_04490 [Porticoccaceae bacterium]|nr:hypothetical protein [Porticoccaceae bacterium]